MKVVNPVKIQKNSNTSDELYQQERLERFFGHNNNMGFFPVGALNCWHGGIHIEGNHAVTAIAKGRVIAYRLAEDYITETYQEKESLYSNSFVLIQHDYKSPNGQELTFYSLYHHLMSVNGMKANKGALIPDFYSKYTAKVKDTANEEIIGLAARASDSISSKTRGDKKSIIPIGYTFELDPLPETKTSLITPPALPKSHWYAHENYKNYKRVKFTDINGVKQTNVYAYISSVYSEKISDTKYKVIFPKAKSNGTARNPDKISQIKPTPTTVDKGVLVYDKPDNQGKGKLLKVVKPGVFGDVEKVDDNWFKVKKKEEYIHKKHLEITKDLKEDVAVTSTNEVKNVDYDIEAGTIIGYTGKYAKPNAEWYSASHIEVFTADSRFEDFFSNKLEDGEQAKVYKTKPNIDFWYTKPLKTPLVSGIKVKVFARTNEYVQIGFDDIEGVVERSNLGSYKQVSGTDYYAVKESQLSSINPIFQDQLKNNSRLYWVSRADSSENNITKAQENQNIKDAKANGTEYIAYRKVILRAKTKEKYWVNASAIPAAPAAVSTSTPEAATPASTSTPAAAVTNPAATTPAVPASTEIETLSGPEEQWVELLEDVSRIYEKKPQATTIEKEALATEVEFKTSVATIEVDDTLWWKIKGTYRDEADSLQYKEGWIRKLKETENYDPSNELDINVFNPFNWESFDWKKEEAPDQYLFQFEDAASAPDFINKIWEIVDLPKQITNDDGTVETIPSDKVLSPHELRSAMKNKKKLRTLSHMIVKHHSEWNYIDNRFSSLKDEITALYEKGIEAEEDGEQKQLLTAVRDEKLKLIEEKTKNLCFWDKITVGDVPQKDRSVRKKKETKAEKSKVSAKTKSRFDFSTNYEVASGPGTSTYVAPPPRPLFLDTVAETDTAPVAEDTPADAGLPARVFPSDSNVWHLHPIAFINQMKLMFPQGETSGECYCNRNITTEEFKDIFTRLRRSEKYNLDIFNGTNCIIPNSDKTIERLTEEFNKTANKYGIKQCIQKIHFIAQIYWESDRLKTGLEYANGNYYNPTGGHAKSKENGNTQVGDGPKYKGRGFMQLTWRNTQIEYLKYASKNTEGSLKGKTDTEIELRSNNYEKYISDDLAYAMDSAGWFWANHKKAGSKYSEIKGKSLNDIALHYDKYQEYISILVNGGGNGKAERKTYYKKLKRFFKIDTKCINNQNNSESIIDDSKTPWIKIGRGELGVEEIHGINYNDPRVLEYHETAGYTKQLIGREITDDWIGDYKDAWCGSFVYWCYFKSGLKKENLNKTGYNAFSWQNWGIASDKQEPCYGALAICDYSHVGFVVGKKGDKIVLLGGNQTGGDDSTKGMVCYTTVKPEKIMAYRYPSDFNIQNINYDLEEVSTNSGSDSFSTSR